MARTTLGLTTAAVAAAAILAPGAVARDVEINVPMPLLGGPIWNPLLLPASQVAPNPPRAGAPSPAPTPSTECMMPCLVTRAPARTESGPVLTPPAPEVPDTDGIPDGVVPADPENAPPPAAELSRRIAPPPALAPSTGDLATAFRSLVAPSAAGWLRWETPVLSWRRVGAASYYNVQVFRGRQRVLNAWTSRRSLRVPDDVLDQGRTYVWVVWPGLGAPGDNRYGVPVGRSTFAITLRPRLVFDRIGSGALGAQVRPRIPGGVLRLTRPGEAPRLVRITANSRVSIRGNAHTLEGLRVRLQSRGPTPPVGLRG